MAYPRGGFANSGEVIERMRTNMCSASRARVRACARGGERVCAGVRGDPASIRVRGRMFMTTGRARAPARRTVLTANGRARARASRAQDVPASSNTARTHPDAVSSSHDLWPRTASRARRLRDRPSGLHR